MVKTKQKLLKNIELNKRYERFWEETPQRKTGSAPFLCLFTLRMRRKSLQPQQIVVALLTHFLVVILTSKILTSIHFAELLCFRFVSGVINQTCKAGCMRGLLTRSLSFKASFFQSGQSGLNSSRFWQSLWWSIHWLNPCVGKFSCRNSCCVWN